MFWGSRNFLGKRYVYSLKIIWVGELYTRGWSLIREWLTQCAQWWWEEQWVQSVQWVSHLGISLSRRPSAVNLGAHSSSQNLLKSDCVLSRSVMSQLFASPWTVARQAPLSMGFSRQDTGVGCHVLLQGSFPTQGLNWGLPLCRWILYCLSHQGLNKTIWVIQRKNFNTSWTISV